MRTILLFASLLVIGAGCAPQDAAAPIPDATPDVNEANCLRSGGAVEAGACFCPDGFAIDPAGFCLDAAGKPGGEMGGLPEAAPSPSPAPAPAPSPVPRTYYDYDYSY